MLSLLRRTLLVVVPSAVIVLAAACSSSDDGGASSSSGGSSGQPDASSSGTTSSGGDSGASSGDDGAPPPPPPSKVNVTTETADFMGETRSYVLAVPKSYDASKAYPLVLSLHATTGDGANQRAVQTFDDITGDEAIVCYPSGDDHDWDQQTPFAQNKDEQFIVALPGILGAKYNIDTSRVFGTAYSAGSFELAFVACNAPGFFLGINPESGGAPYGDGPTDSGGYLKCPLQSPSDTFTGPAAFVVHGADDGTVDPSGGKYGAQFWAHYNGCSDPSPDDWSAVAPAPCVQATGCATNKGVLWCLIPGLGHAPWQEGAASVWAFFKSL